MPTESKIPLTEKRIGALTMGQYAIFCEAGLLATEVHDKLVQADKKKGMPAVGYINVKGKKIYYCRYAFINDTGIYKK